MIKIFNFFFIYIYIFYIVIGYLILKRYLDIDLNIVVNWFRPINFWITIWKDFFCIRDYYVASCVTHIILVISQIVCICLFIILNVNKQYLENLPKLIKDIMLYLRYIGVIFIVIYIILLTDHNINHHFYFKFG